MGPSEWQDDIGFKKYLGCIQQFPTLGRKTELELARRYRTRGDKKAGDLLVQCHLRQVVTIARQFRGYGIRLADLVEEGNIGLLEAVRRFEPSRNLRFITYASYWIRAYILAHVLRQWSIVNGGTGPLQSKMFFRLKRERARLTMELGGDESSIDATLAEKFDTTEERVRLWSHRLSGHDTSLDSAFHRDSNTTLLDMLADQEVDLEQRTANAQRDALVRQAITRIWRVLDDRERLIVETRLLRAAGDEATLAELGRRLGLSRERVRQLEERVKGKLRRALEPMRRAA
ncbi:MAG: RNA polymerase factor sigma-32 [Deltaproteobacteria bacterium]|nr:RNA polymerase factor sigma-32 [Deltaproteobacteria bacterium]